MREGRIALCNRRNRTRRDPRVEKCGEQPGDGSALPFAVAKHLRHDHAQPRVEHVAQRPIHAKPLVARRAQEEAGPQQAILSREKTLDRARPPRSRFGELAASLRGRIKDGGGARSQALETAQPRTLPGRRGHRYGLGEPILAHQLARVLDFFCNPVPGTRWKHLRRPPIKTPGCLIHYSKAQIRVAEERPGERCSLRILRQTHEIFRNAAHLERIATVASRKKCGNLAFETPRGTSVRVAPATRFQQAAGVASDRSNRLGPPSLKMAAGDAASARQLRVGRGPLKIRVEDRSAELFRPLVVAGERRFDNSLERVNRIRHSGMPAD